MLSDGTIERGIIEQLRSAAGGRLRSHDLCLFCLDLYRQTCADPTKIKAAQMFLRIAIKAKPHATDVMLTIDQYRKVTLERAYAEMPELVELVRASERLGLPVPIIVSCKKYLERARRVLPALSKHYFGIEPVLAIGGKDGQVEGFCDGILCLPVSDHYEALPYKVFELFTLIDVLGARRGLIKIDDDIMVKMDFQLDINKVRSEFLTYDYMGKPIASPQHDRSYHLGKCETIIDPIYGKPFLVPFASGPLYFLSKTALSKLATYYLRFPGCLAGEIYEDKAVADVLYAVGIKVTDKPLEEILKIETDQNE